MEGAADGRTEQPELELDEFMRLLPVLDAADLMAISAAYQQADPGPREAARTVAAKVANHRGLIEDLGRLQSSIIQWAGSDISRSSAFTMEGLQTNPMLGDIRMQAVPPLLDAATALLLKTALPRDDRDALLEPVTGVVG